MWDVLFETYWGIWLFYFFFLERACANEVFPVFSTSAARQPGIAVQPPEPGAAAPCRRRRARPGAVPARRGAAAPAAARLHPHRCARSATHRALLRPRAPRAPARAPAAGICAAARATGTVAPTASWELGERSPCSSAQELFIQAGAPCRAAALLGLGSFLGMCFVMNDFSLLEQQSHRFSYLLVPGKMHVLHSFLVFQKPLVASMRKVEKLATKEGIYVV